MEEESGKAVEQERQNPGLVSETDLRKLCDELSTLREQSERALGRALAVVHFHLRKAEKARRAASAKDGAR